MKLHYIGVKLIEAEPQDRDEEPGYQVTYPDGYVSWSPKATFEKAYFPIEECDRITEDTVYHFIQDLDIQDMGDKTTVVAASLSNGFELVESSSCVNPDNYDSVLGTEECMQQIKARVWHLLGFVLSWAVHGLTQPVEEESYEEED